MPTATRTIADGSIITLQQPMQMDPELLRHIILHRSGEKKTATASTAEDEVAVIAKITDWKIWCGLTEVRASVFIGNTEDGDSIVTARIPIKRIEFIRSLPIIVSLKAAQKLMPALLSTITDIEAGEALSADMNNKGGKGVIIGIVDFGCDFAHMNFLNGTKSRILKLWDQRSLQKNSITKYGKLHNQNEINDALTKSNPYVYLGYTPPKASHGTHVMDIAAGNGNGTKIPGVAPESDIIFVELENSDISFEGFEIVGNLGDSVHLLEALEFNFC